MVHETRPTLWTRVYAVSAWTLIGYFSLMAVIHLVLTALFYLGIWDTGVGHVLSYDVPAWLITILDAAAAHLLWVAYRKGTEDPWIGLGLTLAASVIMIGRALWFVIIPVMVVVIITGSTLRVMGKGSTQTNT